MSIVYYYILFTIKNPTGNRQIISTARRCPPGFAAGGMMSRLCQIKASAGSGKTHTLTWRYLRLLAKCSFPGKGHPKSGPGAACDSDWKTIPTSFGDILAITFTNAAVSEIRDRVIARLKKAAIGKDKIRGLDAATADACLDALLIDMGQLNVRTIDSLLHQIVRSAALSLGLHPDFEPSFSTQAVFEPFLENFLRRAETGDQDSMQILDDIIKYFLEHEQDTKNADDGKVFFLRGSLIERMGNMLEDVLLNEGEEFASVEEAENVKNSLAKSLCEAASIVLAEVEKIKDNIGAQGTILKSDPAKALPALASGGYAPLAQYLFTSADDLLNHKIRNIPKETPELDAAYQKFKEIAIACKAFTDYTRDAPLIALASALVADFNTNLSAGGKFPSGLIPVLASRALGHETGVCDALCRLGNRLTHFMIDEFQDTSRPQWEGIAPLVREAISRGGSLTWVGDVKQSIFMWRQASPELFDKILDDPELKLMVPRPQKKRLPRNRRSSKIVVEHNNQLFGRLGERDYAIKILESVFPSTFKALDKAADRVASAFAGSCQELPHGADAGGFVALECLQPENNKDITNVFHELFETRVVDLLTEKHENGQPWSDALILTRSNEEATHYAEALTKANIPVVTENSLSLKGQPLVEQSIAFLKFLDNPANDIAFQTIITGSMFLGHPQTGELESAALDILGLRKNDKPLYQIFKSRYPDIWESIFQSFYEQSTLLAPYDALREWHRRMGAEERFPEGKLFLRSLLEIAQAAESSDIHSIPDFLDYWIEKGGELRAHMPEGINAVKIMTIHKSKGLEAPLVIVPVTLSAQSVNSRKQSKTIVKDFDGWPIPDKKQLRLDVSLNQYYKAEYEEALIQDALEILNRLYVAFTRARRELRIFTYVKYKKVKKEWELDFSALLPTLARNAGLGFPYAMGEIKGTQKIATTVEDDCGSELSPQPFTGIPDAMPWISRLKIARSRLFTNSSAAKKRGTFMHFCLENMHFSDNPHSDARRAFDFGISHSGIDVPPEEHAALLQSLEWFASQPQVGQWLKNGYPEHSLLDEAGNELRVDLLVRDKRGPLVIDYKTGTFSDKNIEQMRNYVRCLENSGQFTGAPSGLLVYLDQKMFQSVTGTETSEPVSICPDPWRERK